MKWDRQGGGQHGERKSVPDQGREGCKMAGPRVIEGRAVSSRHPHSQSDAQLLHVFVTGLEGSECFVWGLPVRLHGPSHILPPPPSVCPPAPSVCPHPWGSGTLLRLILPLFLPSRHEMQMMDQK